MKTMERLPHESGKEYALRVIRENIISLDLEPGMHMSANDLTEYLGLSRGPIREAFNELSKTGIVEVYPQSGCRISLIDEEMINEARFLRRSLECSVVREAAVIASDDEITELKENMALQKFYLENQMSTKLLESDNQFHKRLFEITNMQKIYDLMRNFVIHLDRLRSLTVITIKDIKIVEDHGAILQAIEKHDPDLAAERMTKHLNRDCTDIHEIRNAHPDYFLPERS